MTSIDRLFLRRACELAARGIGSTSPNPPVGAVLVRDGRIIGEGWHRRAGEPHAEVDALAHVRDTAGSTLYVTLEPCNHQGRTPACTRALIEAGVTRVVVGAMDPNPRTNGGGAQALRAHGIDVKVADDPLARTLVEPFAFAIGRNRPFLALKMAMSLDGYVTSEPGVQEWISCEEERLFVRDLRCTYDAVMVGAGTVRVDDPQLTVRPPRHRLHPFTRIVACETDSVPRSSRVFEPVHEYDRTIVLAPAGAREKFAGIADVADVMFVGEASVDELDVPLAMEALRDRGIQSVLCEGGPTFGGRLLAAGLVDRIWWAIAPRFLRTDHAVPVLAGAHLASLSARVRFDRLEQVGDDIVISGLVTNV